LISRKTGNVVEEVVEKRDAVRFSGGWTKLSCAPGFVDTGDVFGEVVSAVEIGESCCGCGCCCCAGC